MANFELFHATRVNVYKVMIALEELQLDYDLMLIDISKGERRNPAMMAGSPTGKLPVLRIHDEPKGSNVIFESAAGLGAYPNIAHWRGTVHRARR
jgi:GSH-dependent disulfide-bond oxidoreductase